MEVPPPQPSSHEHSPNSYNWVQEIFTVFFILPFLKNDFYLLFRFVNSRLSAPDSPFCTLLCDFGPASRLAVFPLRPRLSARFCHEEHEQETARLEQEGSCSWQLLGVSSPEWQRWWTTAAAESGLHLVPALAEEAISQLSSKTPFLWFTLCRDLTPISSAPFSG